MSKVKRESSESGATTSTEATTTSEESDSIDSLHLARSLLRSVTATEDHRIQKWHDRVLKEPQGTFPLLVVKGPAIPCTLTFPEQVRVLEGDFDPVVQRPHAAFMSMVKDEPPLSDSERFVMRLRRYVDGIVQRSRVLMVLRNVQHADECTMGILFQIIADIQRSNLPVAVVFTTTASGLPERIQQRVDLIEELFERPVTEIELNNLTSEELAQALSQVIPNSSELARIIHSQTLGNPLHVQELLDSFVDSGILSYMDEQWSLDEEEAHLLVKPSCSVQSFLADRISQLEPSEAEMLRIASCLGPCVNRVLLQAALSSEVDLDQCVPKSRVILDNKELHFVHPDTHSAAYASIDDKESFHLQLGRRLWRRLDTKQLDEFIFSVLTQFLEAKSLLDVPREREALSEFCIHGGRKAASQSAFRLAADLFRFGIELLGNNPWRTQYSKTLQLHNSLIEMLLCTSNIKEMNQLIDIVFFRAKSPLARVQATIARMCALGSRGSQLEAIDIGTATLESLNERFPCKNDCRSTMMREIKKVGKKLNSMTDDEILSLPQMTDETKLGAVGILHEMYTLAVFTREKFAPFVALKALNIALDSGLCAMSSTGFACYGMMCVYNKGDLAMARRMGRLSLAMLDRFQAVEYKPRVYTAYYGAIHPWSHPLSDSLKPLLHGSNIATITGDIEFAGMCAKKYCLYALATGVRLQDVDREWKLFEYSMRSSGQTEAVAMSLPIIQTVHRLMGVTPQCDYEQEAGVFFEEKNASVRVVYHFVVRMVIAYMFGDHELSERLIREIMSTDIPYVLPPPFIMVFGKVFGILSFISAYERKKNWFMLGKLRKFKKKLETLSRESPYNFLPNTYIVDAEFCSVTGSPKKAVEKFICAVALASEQGFLMHHALANERFAEHHVRYGDLTSAKRYFERSVKVYGEWGAFGKQRHLLGRIQNLYPLGKSSDDAVDI